ncbi:MAG: bifunctional 3,4-dihydroxy-2-butanone-4-phosphate synthase/GTP cyclohydrolase II [Candidatus Diapherotrites archaeon]
MDYKFDSILDSLESLKNGELIVLVDDENRENEGDLVLSAEKATVEKLNFMAKDARGLICVPITTEKASQLDLPRMTQNRDRFDTPFTVSVDAASGGTGISIKDRLLTIETILSKESKPEKLCRPGHVFPLVAKEGGVLQRLGHTEGAVDLMKLAGLEPTAVICEILNDDGSMARLPDLMDFAKKHDLKIVTIKDLIQHKLKDGLQVNKVANVNLPTEFGDFKAVGYSDVIEGREYIALLKGNVSGKQNVLVRVHSACLTGDVFHSKKCDCNSQLETALKMIEKEEQGVVLYIPHHEGRGIGLLNKLKAYELQEQGKDTVEANFALGFPMDKRDFGMGAQILVDLGLTTIRLMTNNPKKLKGLQGFGLDIVEQIPIKTDSNEYNGKYLETKKLKLGHSL